MEPRRGACTSTTSYACVLDCTPGEELRTVVKALLVEELVDPLTDLGMPGRIGMDAIKQQLLISPGRRSRR
jgi:hypothetical protein